MHALSVSLIQAPLQWEDKKANLAYFENQINILKGKTQLVFLPEMFTTGFSMQPALLAEEMDGITVSWMKKMAAACRVILCGSVIIREQNLYYNRLLWVLPTGEIGQYDKRHLFGFAGEDKQYAAGAKRLITSVNGWRFNLQVCYDLRFPVWARQQQRKGEVEYDVLVYAANWPERRRLAWMTLLQARAIENQCYVIGVNRVGNDGNGIYHSGDSMVIGPAGEVLYTKKDEPDVYTFTLDPAPLQQVRAAFPFLKDGDSFTIQHLD